MDPCSVVVSRPAAKSGGNTEHIFGHWIDLLESRSGSAICKHSQIKSYCLTWLIFGCQATRTGVASTSNSFTTSRLFFLRNSNLPARPCDGEPAPVMIYLSSGLKTAFVLGYSVGRSALDAKGFLKARTSHTRIQ